MEEEELGQEAQTFIRAAREANKTPIKNTNVLGPHQGGTSGVNNLDKDQIIEGFIAARTPHSQ
eukprot:12625875-Ditylum_brightwellii.AAC.1